MRYCRTHGEYHASLHPCDENGAFEIPAANEERWLGIALDAAAKADSVGHPLPEEVLRALHVGIRAVLEALATDTDQT